MAWRATHDGLTGLPNRTGLAARIDALVAAAPEQPFAVLFVDLDRFKDANDSFGHEAGDQLLTEAAARLQEAARRFGGDAALVARHGGDEFVIVLPDAGSAERLAMEVVSCLAEPFVLGAEQHAFGGSAGVVMFPVHGRSCDELLRRADTAMYAAKAEGRGRFRVFDADLETAAHLRLAMPAALRRALDGGELVAWFQPRVRADDGGPVGAEALVRWAHPQRGLIHPDDFIGIAEESSLIEDIGRFMLDAACAELVASHGPERGLGRISVNVSARQLASGRLVDDVSSALARHALSHGTLELEITESALVEDRGQAREQLAALRRLGTRVALDDFGSGYSSLSMLRDLPIDVLKIDRAFVVDIATDPGSLAVARAIAALARAFGLTLVAEGVETDAQAVILASLGCDELQGYRYARALPAEAFRAWLAARSPSEPGRGRSDGGGQPTRFSVRANRAPLTT
jgi:diguanylate cyclase (GGDEF)-like protein